MIDQAPGIDHDAAVVVADAGPLIHLDELECLGLLADFAEVWVPEAVWSEVEHHRPLALRNTEVSLLKRRAFGLEQVNMLTTVYTLHSGEREALSLCLELSGAFLLTDDTAARLAAKALTIEAHGTIGVLVRAIRRRQLARAAVLKLLREMSNRCSLHIRPGLLAEIIQRVADTPAPQ